MGAAISVCPAAKVDGPIDRVWAILLDSENYGEWADARFTRFDPPGPAVPRQLMEADTRELGLTFKVRLRIESIDPARHQVVFNVDLPFGVRERTTITSVPIDEGTTRVHFG